MILPDKSIRAYLRPLKKAMMVLASTALMTGNALARDEGGTFPGICPISFFKALATNTSVIKSIQQVSINLSAAQATNTATISSVTTANAFVCPPPNYITSITATNAGQNHQPFIQLTNATTVTVTRGNASGTITVVATVIEFASGVNSIQQGTIGIVVGNTSNTATISAAGTNAFAVHLGSSPSTTSNMNNYLATIELTNSTTVTATIASALGAGTVTVGYVVVDLSSTIIKSVQKLNDTSTANTTNHTNTITSVTAGNSLIFYGGVRCTLTGANWSNVLHTVVLTNGTTVTYTRSGTSATSRTICGTVVEFQSGIFNSAVQRNSIVITAGTSNTDVISSVNTSKSFVNYCGSLTAGATPSVVYTDLVLTNSTTVTNNLNSSGTVTTAYEVAEFI